ncbi:7-cyano-7-deazaguanine synthase [Bdellovibrio bacteriovorus]|uniref:7-cyano-7-deazaguanine synthase n=1 Tax=Bdellovibrio bacteriovorus TaxID=959 RepID=A0A150WJG3_BDEBC|nr:7-cyano-7-deazaguanine synthase QueC [Bdellovibrio bacteriovorus]KYG63661.1 7-cyano-7-deazaguanine synthase [Bdellovibrio bacteriovorus]
MSSRSKKVVVLLSAGLDSTVNIYEAIKHRHEVVLALTFNYGQRAAVKEIECSAKIAKHLNVPHKVIDLPWFKDFNRSSLIVESEKVPTGKDVEIDNLEKSQDTKKSVWVPNRNGIFLNIAAAFAESLNATSVIPGFNAEEAVTFPDNTKEFMDKATQSLHYSTSNHVTVGCYTIHMKKPDMVRLGQGLKIPWEMSWPCYFTGDKWCGECESCQRAKRAFASANVDVKHLFKEA